MFVLFGRNEWQSWHGANGRWLNVWFIIIILKVLSGSSRPLAWPSLLLVWVGGSCSPAPVLSTHCVKLANTAVRSEYLRVRVCVWHDREQRRTGGRGTNNSTNTSLGWFTGKCGGNSWLLARYVRFDTSRRGDCGSLIWAREQGGGLSLWTSLPRQEFNPREGG